MSNFKFFILLISCLLIKFTVISAADNTLHVDLKTVDYVLGETITVRVYTDLPINETVEVVPNYETHKMLMNCTDCKNKILGPEKKEVELVWQAYSPGSVIVYFTVKPIYSDNKIDLNVNNAYFQIAIGRSNWIYLISSICGWCYFLAWIISMYPQVVINFRAKSVVGLNFDYVAFSLIGYSAYAIYNSLFYYSDAFKNEYYRQNPHSNVPVALNDVFFSIHGVVLTAITAVQCLIYERGEQKISHRGQCILYLFLSPCVVLTIFLLNGSIPNYLDYLYFFSYVKIILTIGKYVPQAVFNYKRKSTKGWSIENCVLDLLGGILSILQMLFLAINFDDIKYFTRNYAKLFVGLISCTFDIIFIVQHFFLYRHSNGDQEKGSNASLRLDSEQFENSSLKQSLSLDRIHTISSLSKVIHERRKSFVHCICGNKILCDKN